MKNRTFQRVNEEKKALRREIKYLNNRLKRSEDRERYLYKRSEKHRDLLEDVINELDLSEIAIEKHGPLGTPPSELVRLILNQKDMEISVLKANGVIVRHNARL